MHKLVRPSHRVLARSDGGVEIGVAHVRHPAVFRLLRLVLARVLWPLRLRRDDLRGGEHLRELLERGFLDDRLLAKVRPGQDDRFDDRSLRVIRRDDVGVVQDVRRQSSQTVADDRRQR